MIKSVPDLAAIDQVVSVFETEILAATPFWMPEQRFHLLDDDAGLLGDQPKNANFFRQFDVRFAGDAGRVQSGPPLEREATIVIMIGYLGSVRSRRVEKIMRQDEEKIAIQLLREGVVTKPNRPFSWDVVPPMQTQSLGEDGAASIEIITYTVQYVCDVADY